MKTTTRNLLLAAALAFRASAAVAQAPRAAEAPLSLGDAASAAPGGAAARDAGRAGAGLAAGALEQVLHSGGGVLERAPAEGTLTLVDAAFVPGTATLERAGARDLARAGRALRDAGAARLRLQVWTVPGAPEEDIASRRAAAAARALARGGFPAARIELGVVDAPGATGAGRLLVLGRCLSACQDPATPPR